MARRKPPEIAANAEIIGICRKSEEDPKRQIQSLDDQEKLIRDYYLRLPPEIKAAHQLRIIRTAQSGFVPGLPTVDEVCKNAALGKVFAVFAVTVNRLGRNLTDLGRLTQDLADGFVPYFETTDGKRYTGKDTTTIIMLCLEGAMGWGESADKSKVVYSRMLLRAKEGKHMGRKPFGFKTHHIVLENGEVLRHTVKDEERFQHVLTIFRMAAAGSTYPDIVRWAKKSKITQRVSSTLDENGKERKPRPLDVTTVAGIIKNPYYKGGTRYDGVYENTHEAHITPLLWEAAQLGVARRCRHSGRKKQQELRNLFIFGDTVHCSKCRGVMSPYRKTNKKTGVTHIYYECKNRHTTCRQSIRQETLKEQEEVIGLREQFDAMMDTIVVDDTLLADVREKLAVLHKEKSTLRRAEVERLQKDYIAADAALTKQVLALARADELGVGHVIEAEIKQLKTKMESIQEKLNAAHDEGMGWIDKVLGNFKLIELAREAILHGSPVVRETVIKALCSNVFVNNKKLVSELRSPFREALRKEENELWWAILDLNQ